MGREKKLSNEYKIGDFKVGKTIGQGAFSKVKVGYHKETGQKVAIKIIDKKLMAEKVAKSAKRKEKVKQDQETKKQEQIDPQNQNVEPEKYSTSPTSRRASSPPPPSSKLQQSTSVSTASPTPRSTSEQTGTDKPKLTINPSTAPVKPNPAVISPMSPVSKSANSSLMDQLYAEVKLLMRMDHPNIIGLYQVIDTETECFIIMEYAPGGELIDYIAAKDYLSEKEARKFFRQILSAIDHCHRAHVVHRDLKLENLLLSASRDILITDFGLGRTYTDDPNDLMMTFCGTPNYAAVELITFKPYLGVKTDIWAMGVILYIMCCGKPPFQGHSIPSLYNKIMNIQYTCPDHFSPDLRHLLSRILVKDPNERATLAELYQHRWVNMDEPEPPLQVLPLYSDLTENGMEQITSINNDSNCTIFTFSRYITEFMAASKKYQFNSESGGEVLDGPMNTRRGSVFLNRRASTAGKKSSGSGGGNGMNQVTAADKSSTMPYARRMSAVEKSSTNSSSKVAPVVNGPVGANRLATVDENNVIPSGKSAAGASGVSGERQRRYSYHAGTTGAMPTVPTVSGNGVGVTGGHVRGTTMNDELLSPPASARFKQLDPFSVGQDALPVSSPQASSSTSSTPNNQTSPSISQLSNSTPRRMSLVPVADGILYNLPSGTSPTTPSTPDTLQLHRPSDKAIQDFHLIHKPPKTIRSLRFNFTNNTTSNKPPSAIFQNVHKVLVTLQQQYTKLTFHREDDYYLFSCRLPVPRVTTQTLPDPATLSPYSPSTPASGTGAGTDKGAAPGMQTEDLIFEIEVCKVWLLKIHGVRIKRISGDPLFFKDLYKDIVGRLDL